MKDSEFIQLLNLYLDHEISAADAARLEAEVQSNPHRRTVYRQYCRMQKACKLLTSDFRPETAGDRKVVSFHEQIAAAAPRQARAGNFYTAGAFAAAAACVAIIFVGRSRQAATEATTFAAAEVPQQVAPAVARATTPTAAAAAEVSPTESSVMIAAADIPVGPRALGSGNKASLVNPLWLSGNTQADAMLAAAIQQADAQFAWMHNVQLAPIQTVTPVNDLRFEAKPVSLRPDGRNLGYRAQSQPSGEISAYQFTK